MIQKLKEEVAGATYEAGSLKELNSILNHTPAMPHMLPELSKIASPPRALGMEVLQSSGLEHLQARVI